MSDPSSQLLKSNLKQLRLPTIGAEFAKGPASPLGATAIFSCRAWRRSRTSSGTRVFR